MNVRTCPWLLDNGEICSAPSKNAQHRLGLCETHSAIQYSMHQTEKGRLLQKLGTITHTPGLTYVALTSDGEYKTGYAGSMKPLLPRLRKSFRDGELTRVVTLLDGGESRHLLLQAELAEYRVEGSTATFSPVDDLVRAVSELPRSDRFSDLPRNMTGVSDLFGE